MTDGEEREPLPDLGRAGIPIGESVPERSGFRIVVNRRRAWIMAGAALLGLLVGFIGTDDEGTSSGRHAAP